MPVAVSETAVNLFSAGTAACFADMATFPLDTAKVRLQIQGEGSTSLTIGSKGQALRYNSMVGTLITVAQTEGAKGLYNGLAAGLQRQLFFSTIRIGCYDSTKSFYHSLLVDGKATGSQTFLIRVCAGLTTGGMAVLVAQPTDVVKVRMQAQGHTGVLRYTGCVHAYKTIATEEGARGLWRGVLPNVARNAIVNVAEIVCYDAIKDHLLTSKTMTDGVPCHFVSAVAAGFCATVVASPVDVVKTRFMNAAPGQYRGALDCAIRMFRENGTSAFYKGFTPSFCRIVSWNIVMWLSYEQIKQVMVHSMQPALPL